LLVDSKIVSAKKLEHLRQGCDELTAIFVTILSEQKREAPDSLWKARPLLRIRCGSVFHQPRGAKRFTRRFCKRIRSRLMVILLARSCGGCRDLAGKHQGLLIGSASLENDFDI
jgi:hypothetical protein